MKDSSRIKLVNKYVTRCFLLVVPSGNAVPSVVMWFCFILFFLLSFFGGFVCFLYFVFHFLFVEYCQTTDLNKINSFIITP